MAEMPGLKNSSRAQSRASCAPESAEPEHLRGALTRRNLLGLAAMAVASSVLPSAESVPGLVARQEAAPPSPERISPAMEQLSAYMAEAAQRPLPDEVVEKAKHHIVDTFAAMISGSVLPPGRAALQFASVYGGKEVATVVASKVVCGPIEAAFVNGILAHSDETDDSHGPSRSHPGVSVVPAALAAGEQHGVTGAHFLRAVTLGYDVGPRITMSMGGPQYQAATHRSTHGTVAAFASAAAAGCVADLSKEQMRFVLDYTAQQVSGIGAWARDTQHMEKAFLFGGKPAAGAVTTAMLVGSGWTGVDDIFSGSDNFFDAYAPRENGAVKADPSKLVEKLGERYEIARTNIKKWTVGSPIQAPLDALVGFFQKKSFSATDVKKVVVRVASDEANTVSNRDMPDICMEHMIAIMLLDKTVTFASAHDRARMQAPDVLRERAKVQVVADPRIDARRPRREAIVELTLSDGTELNEWVRDVRGTSDNPMTREEVVAKARDLMKPVLGSASASQLIAKLLSLDTMQSVRELRPLLQKS
jgi:2-methylcitrate dehydratase PrpD